MSAYVIPKHRMDRIVATIMEGPVCLYSTNKDIPWLKQHFLCTLQRLLPQEQGLTLADVIGRTLYRDNVEGVQERYPNDDYWELPGMPPDRSYDPLQYVYEPSQPYSIGAMAAAIDELEYNSSDHPMWESTVSFLIIYRLRRLLLRCLPDYDQDD